MMAATNNRTAVQLCKTDITTTIRFLEDAVKVYTAMNGSTRMQNRIRLMNNHIKKLRNKLTE